MTAKPNHTTDLSDDQLMYEYLENSEVARRRGPISDKKMVARHFCTAQLTEIRYRGLDKRDDFVPHVELSK